MGELELRLRERLFSSWPLPETETAWGKRRQEIRDRMAESDNWSGFKNWPVVSASLYAGRIPNTDAELAELKGVRGENFFVRALEKMGAIPDNGTAIHQAHLLHFYGSIYPDFNIAEFGGGYGEMYRFLYTWGHRGEYYVYDFPELLTLHEYYLVSNQISLDHWHPCYTIKQWLEAKDIDLLVSVCAMSEASLEARYQIWDIAPKSVAIRYQPNWDGVNNAEYFLRIAESLGMQVEQRAAPDYVNHSLIKMKR